MKINKFLFFLTIIFVFTCSSKPNNKTYQYFDDVELQYDGDIQKNNIKTALNDILTLSIEELKTKKYKDYNGNEGKWNLPALIYKHFVPNKQKKTLGSYFYKEIKAKKVQKQIRNILKKMKL